MFRSFKYSIIVLVLISFLAPRKAAAVTAGDAALTVMIGTAAGAVLGASTLPFYGQSGKHTKNIFYGAALGAVVGVFFAAYAGVQEGAPEDEALLREKKPLTVAQWSVADKVAPEDSFLRRADSPFAGSELVVWSPVVQAQF